MHSFVSSDQASILQVDDTIWLRLNDERDVTHFTALVCGVEGTPYAHGLYFFDVTIPSEYPHVPPKVKLLTVDGKTRINPNLYANGKVCLSILGTWHGPGWTQCMTIRTVLIQIQTLFNEDPLQNEPGFEKRGGAKKSVTSYGFGWGALGGRKNQDPYQVRQPRVSPIC